MDSLPAQYAPLEYDSRTDEQLVAMLDERKLSKKGGRQDWIKRMRGQDTYIENGIQALVAQDLPPIRVCFCPPPLMSKMLMISDKQPP